MDGAAEGRSPEVEGFTNRLFGNFSSTPRRSLLRDISHLRFIALTTGIVLACQALGHPDKLNRLNLIQLVSSESKFDALEGLKLVQLTRIYFLLQFFPCCGHVYPASSFHYLSQNF